MPSIVGVLDIHPKQITFHYLGIFAAHIHDQFGNRVTLTGMAKQALQISRTGQSARLRGWRQLTRRLAQSRRSESRHGALLATLRNEPSSRVTRTLPPFGASVTVHLVTVVVTPN